MIFCSLLVNVGPCSEAELLVWLPYWIRHEMIFRPKILTKRPLPVDRKNIGQSVEPAESIGALYEVFVPEMHVIIVTFYWGYDCPTG